MDQCDKYGLCTPVPIQGKMNETIMSRCKIFVEDYEDEITEYIRSDYIHEPNDDFKFCKTINACKGREPPIRKNVKKKKNKNSAEKKKKKKKKKRKKKKKKKKK